MVLPILGRAALLLGKKVAKNIAKKKKKPKKKKKETMAEELDRLEKDPMNKKMDKFLIENQKDIMSGKTTVGDMKKYMGMNKGGLAGRLAKRGYGKARK
jgi:hypothetical protein|tara:strand:+ start:237 stop:533 length:297 start_codon:yes stop_codon:yes gene_type:complete